METYFDDDYTGPRWTYGLQNRPLDIASVPKGWIIDSLRKHADFRWGALDYPFELTTTQRNGFELTFITSK